MLIHDQTANHQLCWDGPVNIHIAKNAPTSVSNPLIALDILKQHWEDEAKDQSYQDAVIACLKAVQGNGDLATARAAFILAAEQLGPVREGPPEPENLRIGPGNYRCHRT